MRKINVNVAKDLVTINSGDCLVEIHLGVGAEVHVPSRTAKASMHRKPSNYSAQSWGRKGFWRTYGNGNSVWVNPTTCKRRAQ